MRTRSWLFQASIQSPAKWVANASSIISPFSRIIYSEGFHLGRCPGIVKLCQLAQMEQMYDPSNEDRIGRDSGTERKYWRIMKMYSPFLSPIAVALSAR